MAQEQQTDSPLTFAELQAMSAEQIAAAPLYRFQNLDASILDQVEALDKNRKEAFEKNFIAALTPVDSSQLALPPQTAMDTARSTLTSDGFITSLAAAGWGMDAATLSQMSMSTAQKVQMQNGVKAALNTAATTPPPLPATPPPLPATPPPVPAAAAKELVDDAAKVSKNLGTTATKKIASESLEQAGKTLTREVVEEVGEKAAMRMGGRVIPVIGVGLSVGLDGYDAYNAFKEGDNRKGTAIVVGAGAALAAGVGTGAVIGTFIPVPIVGTAVGAVAGGVIGTGAYFLGKWFGGKAYDAVTGTTPDSDKTAPVSSTPVASAAPTPKAPQPTVQNTAEADIAASPLGPRGQLKQAWTMEGAVTADIARQVSLNNKEEVKMSLTPGPMV